MRPLEVGSVAALAVAFILGSLVEAAPVYAQEAEARLGWFNTAELSFVSTAGNSEATTAGFKYTLRRQQQRSRFKLTADGIRAESDRLTRFAVGTSADDFTLVDESESELTAENYRVSGRYDRDLSRHTFWFASLGWQRDEFAGIQNRYSAAGGIGTTWFDSEATHLRTDYGITFTQQDDVVKEPGTSDNFLGLRLSIDYAKRLTETTSYEAILEVDENLDETDDLRADLTQGLSVAMTEKLGLKLSWELKFDNEPALERVGLRLPDGSPTGETVFVPVDDLDSVLRVALVVNF